MKTQLQEDIGDSHPPAPPHAAHEAATSDAGAWATPPPLSDPWPADDPPVWRAPAAPAYSQAEDEPDWFERWGRRAAAGTAILLATLAVGGAGLWLYKESKVEQSLSVLARAPIPARHAMPAPAAHAQAGDTQHAQQALATQPAAATAAAAAVDAPPLLADLPPPQAGSQEAPPAIASAPDRIRKRASAPRSRTASAAQLKAKSAIGKPGRTAPLAETLRLCRAAGYHAAKCVQLDCTATQYGLACKGARNVRR